MIKVECDLVGVAPLSFSKKVLSEKETGELPDVYEERTWQERLHITKDDEVFIPPGALKNCLTECARYLSESIPGKGKQTFTKNFEAGIMIVEPLLLGIKANSDKVQKERIFVSSTGTKGRGKRVWKNFPTILDWQTHVEILVFDPVLTAKPEKIKEYLTHAGKFIGLLRFRPRNGGFYGRFDVKNFKVSAAKVA